MIDYQSYPPHSGTIHLDQFHPFFISFFLAISFENQYNKLFPKVFYYFSHPLFTFLALEPKF